MTITMTYGSDVATPLLIDGWAQTREARNVAHDIIGGGVEFTHTPLRPRSGTIRALFLVEADALAAEAIHVTAPYVDLFSDERAIANMRYVVVNGGISVDLDEQTRDAWWLSVDFLEDVP